MVPAVRCSSCSPLGKFWVGSGDESVVAATTVRFRNGLSSESVDGCGRTVGIKRPLTLYIAVGGKQFFQLHFKQFIGYGSEG